MFKTNATVDNGILRVVIGVFLYSILIIGLVVAVYIVRASQQGTILTQGYNEQAFQAIRIGSNKKQVRSSIGVPLEIEEVYDITNRKPDPVELWKYSRPRNGYCWWNVRYIYYDKKVGTVYRKDSYIMDP